MDHDVDDDLITLVLNTRNPMKPDQLTIRYAQANQPWTVPYSHGVVLAEATVPHILGTHCALHAAKSVGKLASVFEELDHRGGPTADHIETIRAMAADLATAALRFANLYGFDLANALVDRVEEKNGVNILNLEKPK